MQILPLHDNVQFNILITLRSYKINVMLTDVGINPVIMSHVIQNCPKLY